MQGGGDMGAIPNKLPGFQDIEKDPEACARYEEVCGVAVIPKWEEPDADVRGDGARGVERALRDRREPGELKPTSAVLASSWGTSTRSSSRTCS